MIVDDCQRWTERRESRRPAGEPIRTSAYDVESIDADATARSFVARHHYSRIASSTAHRFGLYKRGELAGVALFGPPPSMNAHRFVFPTLGTKEGVTLGRLVLLDEVPGNGESWFIARCFELLAQRGVVGVESCSDPHPRTDKSGAIVFPGHVGTIYQATNGRYVGKTNDSTIRIFPDGMVLSNRSCGKVKRGERGDDHPVSQLELWGATPLNDNEDAYQWLSYWRPRLTVTMRHRGNHRYIWCLDRRRRGEVLRAPALAYPKLDERAA